MTSEVTSKLASGMLRVDMWNNSIVKTPLVTME